MNVVEGEPNDRQMTTGNHTVRDIYCIKCGTTLGWKYVRMTLCILVYPSLTCATRIYTALLSSDWTGLELSLYFLCVIQDRAYETSQKYKEGKFILERNLLVDVQ